MDTTANTRANGSAYYQLQENQPVRLSGAMGQVVECLSGAAWLTLYGESDDVVLHAGECYRIPNDGLALIDAIVDGRVRVRAASGVAARQPWYRKLA